MSEERIVYLDHWSITTHAHYPATEPCLRGVAFGHPHFGDGERIPATSPIRELRAGRVVTLTGTVYELGRPDPNAASKAFALSREFAYLTLLLWFVSLQDPGAPPSITSQPPEPGPAPLVLAFAATPKDGGSSSIQ
jgi:hypothetical protein